MSLKIFRFFFYFSFFIFCIWSYYYYGFSILRVEGVSMEPTIYNGDIILISKQNYIIEKDDICIFEAEDRILIKRVLEVNLINISSSNYYFISDNMYKSSIDSRHLGWIDQRKVKAKYICTIF